MHIDMKILNLLLSEVSDGVLCQDPAGRITFWNKKVADITGHKEYEVLGRKCNEGIIQHLDEDGNVMCGTDRCPRNLATTDCGACEGHYYIHSKEGSLVPVQSRVLKIQSEQQPVGTATFFIDETPLEVFKKQIAELERLALLDPLTRIGNRRYGELLVSKMMDKYNRDGEAFGVLFIDIDHFKRVNDEYGHHTGDKMLSMVARMLKYSLRSFDDLARWGGEEFIATINNVTAQELSKIADRSRRLIAEAHVLHNGRPVKVTASIGMSIVRSGDSTEDIVARADKAMYYSKQGGRNRVTGSFKIL